MPDGCLDLLREGVRRVLAGAVTFPSYLLFHALFRHRIWCVGEMGHGCCDGQERNGTYRKRVRMKILQNRFLHILWLFGFSGEKGFAGIKGACGGQFAATRRKSLE